MTKKYKNAPIIKAYITELKEHKDSSKVTFPSFKIWLQQKNPSEYERYMKLCKQREE